MPLMAVPFGGRFGRLPVHVAHTDGPQDLTEDLQ